MMSIAKRIGMAASVLGLVAGSAARASANYTYNVILSVPDGSGLGTDTVTGTVTVDKLGTLSASDFVAYSLTLSGPGGSAAITQSSPGAFVEIDSPITVTATTSALLVTLPGLELGTFRFSIGDNRYFFQFLEFDGYGEELAVEGPSEGVLPLSPNGSTQTFGTSAFSSVPEPSSLALCGIAGTIGLVVARVRRKRAGD